MSRPCICLDLAILIILVDNTTLKTPLLHIQRDSKRWTQFLLLASSSNEWRFRRLHFPKGRSSTPLTPGCSTFSEWICTSTMDRSRQEKKTWRFSSGPRDFLISHPATFSCGFHKRSSLCTISTNNFGRPKKSITTAVNSVTQDILLQVWNEFSCRLDVTRAAGGGYIEHI